MLHGYLALKLSWEFFHKAPDTLSEVERGQLTGLAQRQDKIEQRILVSPEAASVVIPAQTLATRLGEIRQRYAGDDEFVRDLARIGLTQAELAQSVERDLRVEAVLERVASAAPRVTEVDAEIYYRLHPEAFERPEMRMLRHILVTFDNPQQRANATTLLEGLHHSVQDIAAFAKAALRHSQCPTAVDGGKLGSIKRGQLFPELEPAAFALAEGEISSVLASPIGLHIIMCEAINPGETLSFAAARERIIERLGDQRRQKLQREWIRQATQQRR